MHNFLIKNNINKKNIEIGTYSTGGKNLKFTQKGGKSFKNIQNGGEGYYLAISECPIGGLPPVKSYQTCDKTLTKQCLPSIKGGSKKINKYKNQKGGEGYRLALNECPIGGLPPVNSYPTCNKSVSNKCSSSVSGGSKKYKKHKK